MPPKKKAQDSENESDDPSVELIAEDSSDDDNDDNFDESSQDDKSSKKRKEEDFEDDPPKKKAKNSKATDAKKKATPAKKSKSDKDEKKTTTKKTTVKDDKKKEKKATIRDTDTIQEMLLPYIQKNNRPHAVQSLITAFRGQFGKAACDKALDKLVKNGDVTLKVANKAKVYYVAQSGLECVSKDELVSMDEEIKETLIKLKQTTEEVKDLGKKRDESVNSMTTEQLKAKIESQKADIKKKTEKLELLQATPLISDEDNKKLDTKLEMYLKEWKKRKALCTNMVDMLSDSENKKRAEVMEERDIELDHVDITTIGKL